MFTAIAISGKICSGKTTLAEAIREVDNRYKICPVAGSIKRAVYKAVDSIEDGNKDVFREAYQCVGGLGRALHGNTFWVNKLVRECQANGWNSIIVDDVRLPDEVEVLTGMTDRNFVIRLNVSQEAQQRFHIAKYGVELGEEKRLDFTETALDNYPKNYWDLEFPEDLDMETIINGTVRILAEHSILR